MATATQLQLSTSTLATQTFPIPSDEAISLANLCRPALNHLSEHLSSFDPRKAYTADDILDLPLAQHRITDALHDLPRRRSARHDLALEIASLLHPVHDGSLTAVIRYDADRVRLRAWAVLQRKYDLLQATRRNGHTARGMSGGAAPGVQAPVWAARITNQGPWDPEKTPISLDGVPAVPMPVRVAEEEELAPVLAHLRQNGTFTLLDGENDEEGQGNGAHIEPYYGVQGARFHKGVVYQDGRLDMCKMVVGPDHIWQLMDSLRPNDFVRHFLLGNNIVGPSGAQAIAKFIRDLPGRIETWYLGGNCIAGPSLRTLVDAIVESPVVTNVWLKRNPLGPDAAVDLFRLVTESKQLRTLDLDQTQLGDRGAADLFDRLAAYEGPQGSKLPLRQIYLNGNGISTKAAKAVSRFLASPHCGLSSIYMSATPLGDEGAEALAEALPKAPYLTRLFLQSTGISTKGAVTVCKALVGHPGIRAVDLGQAFSTQDLGLAYNYIEDGAVSALLELLRSTPQLEYLNLSHCAISPPGLLKLSSAILKTPSLLFYNAISIVADPTRKAMTFTPSRDHPFPDPAAPLPTQVQSEKAVRGHLEANVRARYGANISYQEFIAEEKRWLISDKVVRKIDSFSRNRDAGLARRRLMTLVKDWDEDDDTLERVMRAQGPSGMDIVSAA